MGRKRRPGDRAVAPAPPAPLRDRRSGWQPSMRWNARGSCVASAGVTHRVVPFDCEGHAGALEVADHLDAHGTNQRGFPAVQIRAMDDLPKRAHDAVRTAGLEEVDGPERSLPIGEEGLEL